MLSNCTKSSETFFIERKGCPLCGRAGRLIIDVPLENAHLQSWLTEKYVSRIPNDVLKMCRYKLYCCEDCQFLYQSDVLKDYWLGELYEKWIDPQESRLKNWTQRRSKGNHEVQVASMIGRMSFTSQEPVRVLDFGAGWGDWACLVQCLGYQVDACELSASRRDHLFARGLTPVDIKEDFREMYVFIRAEQVFEHLVDPVAVLVRLTGLMVRGGIVYISVPNILPLYRKLEAVAKLDITNDELKLIAPLEHVNGFTYKSLNKLAERVGLVPTVLRPGMIDLSRGILRGLATWFLTPLRKSTCHTFMKSN